MQIPACLRVKLLELYKNQATQNLLASFLVRGIRGKLTFDAAVPIDVAPAASLGGDPDLVGASRIGAGLGRPVAVGALVKRVHRASGRGADTHHRIRH